MRAVLLAGANPAPSEGNHTERGDYFRTSASFAASISVRGNSLASFGQSCRTMSEIFDYKKYAIACEVWNSDT